MTSQIVTEPPGVMNLHGYHGNQIDLPHDKLCMLTSPVRQPPFKNATGDKVTLAILYTNISVLNVNTLILLCRNNISGPNLQLQQECPTSCAC